MLSMSSNNVQYCNVIKCLKEITFFAINLRSLTLRHPNLKTLFLIYLGLGVLNCIIHTYLPAIRENQLQSLDDILAISCALWILET